jgi:putative oxidoreductase
MLLAALLIELLGSLSLILGFRARIAAAILFACLIPVTFAFHTLMSTNFEKNLGVMGSAGRSARGPAAFPVTSRDAKPVQNSSPLYCF